ncbi:hypothetical protein KFF05_16445 [bacterium SCSIO 12827]|nr:hypothetical protein KFF05_16445 [bacterium SCSIO 12827]
MIWLIVILLFCILLVLLGGGNFVRATLSFIAYAGIFVLVAIASGDPIRVFKWTLWSFPVLVVFVLAVYIYDRRKSGRDQRPNAQGIVRQFLPSVWVGLSRNDYLGAAAMVLGVAAICFFALYALTP